MQKYAVDMSLWRADPARARDLAAGRIPKADCSRPLVELMAVGEVLTWGDRGDVRLKVGLLLSLCC